MEQKKHTVLAIGAHIGDAELTAGALLATAAVNGGKAVTLALTAGEKGAPPGADIAEYRRNKIAEAEAFARELGGEAGHALETIILSSSVLYELIGPGAAKLSLYLSGSYSDQLEVVAPVPETGPDGEKKSEVELLIERIQKIQSELPAHTVNENERAFTDAAEEYYKEQFVRSRRDPRNRLL